MKNLFFIPMLVLILAACSPSNKTNNAGSEKDISPSIEKREYTFVETVTQENSDYSSTEVERNPVKIVATSDTAAFLIAYRNHCITEAWHRKDRLRPAPGSFRIYDDTGVDIMPSILALDKVDQDKIKQRIKAVRAEVFKIYEVKEEY